MTFRIAVVQPITHRPPDDEKNVADAVKAIERAASEGADFVCFPENYPGPWRMPAAYDPIPALAEAAAKHRIHAVFGTIEPIDAQAATAYNLVVMAFPDGRAPALYRRTHPNGPWIYTGGKTQRPGNSNMSPAATIRSSTPRTAKSDSRCAAKSICRKSPGLWRCAAPN